MIGQKYQITDIIKESQQKSIYRVQTFTKQGKKLSFIIKKFLQGDIRYYQKQLEMYNVVLKDAHLKGFAQLKDIVQQKECCSLVFGQLGESVETLRKRVGGRLTLKTTLMVGLQIIDRLQYLHSKGYIHGDVQPSNMVIGAGKMAHKVYLIDFEFSSQYMVNGSHIGQQMVDNFTGSIRYCSLGANNHKNMSRRDDLESLIYAMVLMLKGYLPWFELKSQTLIEAYNQTAHIKKEKTYQLLQGLPQAFGSLLNYVKGLKFEEKPNYDKIRNQFLAVMKKNGYEIDYKFDWTFV